MCAAFFFLVIAFDGPQLHIKQRPPDTSITCLSKNHSYHSVGQQRLLCDFCSSNRAHAIVSMRSAGNMGTQTCRTKTPAARQLAM